MQTSQHWDDFWLNTTSLSSFAEGEAAAGYQGELLAFWHNQFITLAGSASLLDIGTGNGAIAVAARQFSNQNSLTYSVHATDAANIDPINTFSQQLELLKVLKEINFYPNCPAECLPFASNSFDFVSSQFALEYADSELAIPELFRVLKPGGKLVAVMHDKDTQLTHDCVAGIEVLELFLTRTSFFPIARELIQGLIKRQFVVDPKNLTEEVQQLNQQLVSLVKDIEMQITANQQQWFTDFMSKLAKLIMTPKDGSLAVLDKLQYDYSASLQRLKDQTVAALDRNKINKLQNLCSRNLYNASFAKLDIDQKFFGQVLIIEK